MAERSAAEIQIGGKVRRSVAQSLCKIINESGASLEWGGGRCHLNTLDELLQARSAYGGDPSRVAHLVQSFLKKFSPDQCWSLTYATTCSKLRIGEFGGGAVFVTADVIRWNNSYDFVEEQRKSFEQCRQHDRRLIRKAAELGIDPEQFDEAVHEAASSAASAINNGGLEDQIVYLVEQLGLEETEKIIDGSKNSESEDSIRSIK